MSQFRKLDPWVAGERFDDGQRGVSILLVFRPRGIERRPPIEAPERRRCRLGP
jgi:hypothetical protein